MQPRRPAPRLATMKTIEDEAMKKFMKSVTYLLAAAALGTLVIVFLQSTSMLAGS